MIILLSLIPGLLVGLNCSSFAQDGFEGIAHYKSSINIESINAVGSDMNPEMQQSIRKQIAQQMQRDFTLTFNLQEANWKEKEALDPVSGPANNGGVQVRISTGNAESYINPSKNEFMEETEIFGKRFLIKDELPEFKWKITNEKKKISDYTVTKAVYTDITERMMMTLSDNEHSSETVTDTTTVVAWFTTEIPVSQGPNNTYGLPGLILELKEDNLTFLCTKIELNPTTPVSIRKPTKGKVVTREEAETIREEKMQEMMKKYDTGDGGTTRVIRIGG